MKMPDYFGTEVELVSMTRHEWSFKTTGKIDTGATRTSIDYRLARALRLREVGEITVRNALGKQKRKTVLLAIKVFGRHNIIEATVANRNKMKSPIIIGQDLLGDDEE